MASWLEGVSVGLESSSRSCLKSLPAYGLALCCFAAFESLTLLYLLIPNIIIIVIILGKRLTLAIYKAKLFIKRTWQHGATLWRRKDQIAPRQHSTLRQAQRPLRSANAERRSEEETFGRCHNFAHLQPLLWSPLAVGTCKLAVLQGHRLWRSESLQITN